jgi:hypothetical protein
MSHHKTTFKTVTAAALALAALAPALGCSAE